MHTKHKIQNTKYIVGFTLIEMLVAVGIFTIAALGITGMFLSLNKTQQTIRDKENILNQLRFAVDLVGQEVLSGSAFPDPADTCPSGGPTTFAQGCPELIYATKVRPDIQLRRIEYCLDSNADDSIDQCPGSGNGIIMRAEQKTFGDCKDLPFINRSPYSAIRPQCFQQFTSNQSTLNSLKFFVDHKADDQQPIITISLDGTIKNESFRLSSSFSPRLQQDPTALPPNDTELPIVTIISPASPHTTGSANVTATGNATDNVGVMKINWRNNTSGASGTVWTCLSPSCADPGQTLVLWTSPAIVLNPGVQNTIAIEAIDKEGNKGTATLIVNSTGSLATPILSGSASCSTLGQERIRLSWGSVAGGSDYHIYRCDGSCDPRLPADGGTGTQIATDSASPFYNTTTFPSGDPIVPGNTYSYRLRAHNHTSMAFSGYSNTVTVTALTLAACPDKHYECVSNMCTAVLPGGPNLDGCSSSGQCCGGSCAIIGSGSFTLNASPKYIRVGVSGTSTTKRTSTNTTITASPSGTFQADIALTASGGPAQIERNFSDIMLSFSGGSYEDSKFFVRIPDSTATGQYTLTVTGTGGGKTHAISVILDVFATGGGQL